MSALEESIYIAMVAERARLGMHDFEFSARKAIDAAKAWREVKSEPINPPLTSDVMLAQTFVKPGTEAIEKFVGLRSSVILSEEQVDMQRAHRQAGGVAGRGVAYSMGEDPGPPLEMPRFVGTIEWAFQQMRAGKAVRRRSWPTPINIALGTTFALENADVNATDWETEGGI